MACSEHSFTVGPVGSRSPGKAGLREIADNIAQKAGKIATVLGASALVAGVSLPKDTSSSTPTCITSSMMQFEVCLI